MQANNHEQSYDDRRILHNLMVKINQLAAKSLMLVRVQKSFPVLLKSPQLIKVIDLNSESHETIIDLK